MVMKPTDEEIKNEVRSIVMAGLNNPASQKTLTGLAKWARDKARAWTKTNRELPPYRKEVLGYLDNGNISRSN